jgi:hypothetical protein
MQCRFQRGIGARTTGFGTVAVSDVSEPFPGRRVCYLAPLLMGARSERRRPRWRPNSRVADAFTREDDR